ncbi:MAG: hypothetical protein WC784_04465 [Candidatus Shapirobacteria bacterium]|jgi:hypothetical protein
MTEKFIDEEARKKAVIAGATPDKDDYCACPRCGSRDIHEGGTALDDCCVRCDDCNYYLTGTNGIELLGRWNNLDRSGNKIYL